MRVQLTAARGTLADVTATVRGANCDWRSRSSCACYDDLRTLLWSPEHPHLLDAVLTLLRDDEVIDQVTSYVGLRMLAWPTAVFC